MNIGVILPNWVGDLVMATPTLRAIRRHFGPEARLTGVMQPYLSDVLAGTNWLDETIYFDRKSSCSDLQTWAVTEQLRRRRLDLVMLLTNSLRAAVIAWLSGAKHRAGYVRRGRGMLLTHKLYPPRDGRRLTSISAVDYYLELAYAIGCSVERPNLELATSPEDEREACQLWNRLGLAGADRVVIFNTGAFYGAARHWPTEYYVELAQRIVESSSTAVLIICGPAEREDAANIERRVSNPRVKSMADENLSIGLAKACIRRSHLMVTTDSGPRHIAAAFGVPAVSLFGPTDPKWSINYHPAELRLQQHLPCSPCGKRVCPLGHHRCMRELSVDNVFNAVRRSLDASYAPMAA